MSKEEFDIMYDELFEETDFTDYIKKEKEPKTNEEQEFDMCEILEETK